MNWTDQRVIRRSFDDITVTASIIIYCEWLMLSPLLQHMSVKFASLFLSQILRQLEFNTAPCFCFDVSEMEVDHQPTDEQGFVSPSPDSTLCN